MKALIIKTFYMEAAQRLPGSRGTLTGGSYRIDLLAEGPVQEPVGWVVDYAELKTLFEPVRQQLDHHCLNDISGLEEDVSPQALEAWIADQLRPWPAWFSGVRVYPPLPLDFCLNKLDDDPIAKLPERHIFSFCAAQSLPNLPEGHPCRELHGHTYQVEIACACDETLENHARRLFDLLHERYLNQIPGLEQATAERIAAWAWEKLTAWGAAPLLVGIQETPNNRCYYFGK